MIRAAILGLALAAGGTLAVLQSPVLAANAAQPNSNVDRSNDRGNDTGNSRVDGLNRGQLDENQGVRNPALGTVPAQGPAPEAPPPPPPPPR